MDKVKVLLAGAGGYGKNYVEALLEDGDALGAQLVGVVQPRMEMRPVLARRLSERGIPVASSLPLLFSMLHTTPEAAIVCSPIQFHFEQCYDLLSRGCHVLCEKPVVSEWNQAQALESFAKEKGLTLAVAYQRSWSEAMQRLKQDVAQGRYGRPVSMRGLYLAGRSDLYYTRNKWAGRFFDREGRVILDGVMHNAASHHLHAMLYLLGENGLDSAATVKTVRGEWCRAHDIPSYDTAVVKVETAECPQVLMAASHVFAGREVNRYRWVWEHGYAEGDWQASTTLQVHSEDGLIDYGPAELSTEEVLKAFIHDLQTKTPVPCSITAAKAEVAVCKGLYLSAGRVKTVPAHELQLVRGAVGSADDGAIFTVCPKLSTLMEMCFQKGKLPTELDAPLGGKCPEVGMEDIGHGLLDG